MIETVLLIGGIATVGGVSYLISRSAQQRRARRWLSAAMACGVRDLSPTEVVGFPQKVTGTKDGRSVTIERYTRGKHSHGTRVTISPLDAVADLKLRGEDFGTALQKGLGKREVELGDPTFDGRFLIEGPAPLALAVLDAPTRSLVLSALGGRTLVEGSGGRDWLTGQGELAQSALVVEFPEGVGDKVEQHLAGALATLLGLAANLAVPRDVPRQLADNALNDPLWAVRLANLRTLARECQEHAETSRMLRGALSDQSEEIRLTAAIALGSAEGDATLLQLALGPGPDAISAGAVAALGRRLSAEHAIQGLDEAFSAGRLETASACMEALSRQGLAAGTASAEPYLIRAVEHEHARLRLAAARALARLGTTRAVIPLQEAADRFGGELRRMCRQAVAEIQARAKGATPGQLSLAAGQAGGALSLAHDAGGEVSLGED